MHSLHHSSYYTGISLCIEIVRFTHTMTASTSTLKNNVAHLMHIGTVRSMYLPIINGSACCGIGLAPRAHVHIHVHNVPRGRRFQKTSRILYVILVDI